MDFLCLAVLGKPENTEVFSPAKDKGEICFKSMMGMSATFMMASGRAKMQFALPACYFTAR